MKKNTYDFPVEKQDIFLANRKTPIAGRKAIVRLDTNDPVSIVSDDYHVVEHKDVINMFDNVKGLNRNRTEVCKDGAVLFAEYGFTKVSVKAKADIVKGDAVSFKLRVFNSYNTYCSVGFEIIALRLVCTNGLVVPNAIASLSYRHYESANVEKLQDNIITRLGDATKVIDLWRDWRKVNPSENRIKKYLESVRMGDKIRKELLGQSIEAKSKDGLWGVFNVMTRYTTHGIKVRNEADRAYAQRQKENRLLYKFYDFPWKEGGK